MARTIVIDCQERSDGLFDVFEFASTWSGFRRASGVTADEAWKIADQAVVCDGQKLSVRGLGRRKAASS